MGKYRIAFVIDMFLYWSRKGGQIALGLLAMALLARGGAAAGEVPQWVYLACLVGAAVPGLWAAVPSYQAYRIWKSGVPADARITNIEKLGQRGSSSSRLIKTRVHFSYAVDGQDYTGVSSAGSPSRTALLPTGGTLPIFYLPRQPETARWAEDLPLRFPPLYTGR